MYTLYPTHTHTRTHTQVIMESFKTDGGFMFPDEPRSWQGRLCGEIGPTMMQVRMMDCFGDDDALDKKVDELEKALFKLLPEKQSTLEQDAHINRRSGSQLVTITSTNFHLISSSIESASAVVLFISDASELDRCCQHELATACAFGRPAVPVLVGISSDTAKSDTAKWPPPGFTHGLTQGQCLHVKSLSKLDSPQELKACVDSIMALVAKAAEAPDKYRLQPIETASPIRRTMPLRQQGNVRPAEGAARAPLKIYSEEQVKAMTQDFSGRRRLGRGGCGQVFKGAENDGSEVAIKVLHYRMCSRAHYKMCSLTNCRMCSLTNYRMCFLTAMKVLHYEGVSADQKTELMRHMAREVRFLN